MTTHPRLDTTCLRPLSSWCLTALLTALIGVGAAPGLASAQPTGSITGTVTDAGSSAPLPNVWVQCYNASSAQVGSMVTDASGGYTIASLPDGTYYLVTVNGLGYADELFDSLACLNATCPVTGGTGVSVTGGATTSGVNFALALGGRVSGRVTDAATGSPITNTAWVDFFDATGRFVGNGGWPDSEGNYTTAALWPGSYFAKTNNNGDYLNEVYNNLPGSTNVTSGQSFAVTVGAITPGVDFALSRGGRIAGRITDAPSAAGIPGATAWVKNPDGSGLVGVFVDADGYYTTPAVPPGSYYVVTLNAPGHIGKIYNDQPWPFDDSSVSAGTLVSVTAGNTTADINFSLLRGGSVSGQVLDETSGEPIAGARVVLVDANGLGKIWSTTDATGHYTLERGAPDGTYYIRTGNKDGYFGVPGYLDELYPDIPCPYHCAGSLGTPIVIANGQDVTGINFAIRHGARVGGRITSSITGLGIANVRLELYSAGATFFTNGYSDYTMSDADGNWLMPWAYPTGTYYAKTVSAPGHFNELYDNIPCKTSCDARTGTPIALVLGQTTSGVSFALDPAGSITGTVTAAGSAAPLSGVTVYVYNASGSSVGSATTDASGVYTKGGLTTGTYFVKTWNTLGYIDEVYNNLPCNGESCPSVTTGTGVSVTTGATTGGIDFGLVLGGSITGTVTAASGGAPLSSVTVNIYNASGVSVGSAATNASGVYTKTGLPAGTYFARASKSSYSGEFYDNLPVWTSVTASTPIVVSAGAQTTANFALDVNTGPNTSATAVVLPLGTTENLHYTNGIAPDTIWYKFEVPPEDAGKDLRVNVRITSPYPVPPPANWRSDTDFDLLDASLAVRGIAISGSDNETLYLHNVTPGWYYIYANYFTTTYADSDISARYSISIETGTAFGVGYISGRLVDGNGDGLAQVQIRVSAVPANHNISFPIVTSDAAGYFSIATTPGAHDLLFSGDGQTSVNQPEVNVVSEYYSHKATAAAADHITVAEGDTLSLGNITLEVGAIITGQVTNQSGTPLSTATVYSYDLAGNSRSYVRTDASGNYTLRRVPVGGAKISFTKSAYAAEYYDDQPSLGSGAALATQAGVTMAGVNAVLTAGGSIAGSVKNTQAAPLAVKVWLYSALDATFSRASYTTSASTGTFSFTYVKPGDYKIYVDPLSTGFPPAWYGNAMSFTAAATVTVTEGGTVSGINIVLAPRGGGDFTGDFKADILWRHASGGDVWLWPMNGSERQSESYVRRVPDTTWEIRGLGDQDGDGGADILWRNSVSGQIYFWPMDGNTPLDEIYVGTVDPAYDIVGTGDFDGDGNSDILWRHTTLGDVWIWLMDGATPKPGGQVYIDRVDPAYIVKGVGDLDADTKADIVWHHATTGEVWVWPMNGTTRLDQIWVGTVWDTGYQIQGVADFTGEGRADIVWWHTARGEVWVWTMNGATRDAETWVGTVPDTNYRIAGTGDYNGDTKADILWRNAVNGEVWVWIMDGTTKLSETWVATVPDVGYQIIR